MPSLPVVVLARHGRRCHSNAGGELHLSGGQEHFGWGRERIPLHFEYQHEHEQLHLANATIAGATPLWEWIGDQPATVFSY